MQSLDKGCRLLYLASFQFVLLMTLNYSHLSNLAKGKYRTFHYQKRCIWNSMFPVKTANFAFSFETPNSGLYRYVTRTNVCSLIIRTGIEERNIPARNITI